MVEFDPLLLSGVDEIDSAHRELFARIGALLEASRNRRSAEEVVRLLEFLGGYAVEHFTNEERMMEELGYPRLDGHRGEHRHFLAEFGILRHELKSEGPTPLFAIRVGNRVTQYLREHIYRTDRLLGEWLRARR